jgi:hypothetical protein
MIFTAISPLPPGLTLSPSGLLTGVPTVPFTGNITFQVVDGSDIAVHTTFVNIQPLGPAIPPIAETRGQEIGVLFEIDIGIRQESKTTLEYTIEPEISLINPSFFGEPTVIFEIEIYLEAGGGGSGGS